MVDDSTVCWLDLTGSGSETAAHVLQNGRLTVMFVALEGSPKILRLHGTGEIIPRGRLHLPKFSSIATIFQKTRYYIYSAQLASYSQQMHKYYSKLIPHIEKQYPYIVEQLLCILVQLIHAQVIHTVFKL